LDTILVKKNEKNEKIRSGEKMKKGQTSIEFMIIILIVIVYLVTVTRPLVEIAYISIEDIKSLTQTNNETQKILQTINRVNNFSAGTQETIQLVIPKNSEIFCYTDGNIGFKTKIDQNKITGDSTLQCPNNICDKNYYTGNNIECVISRLVGVTKLIVEKETGTIKLRQRGS